ncbi:MAG: DegV family protein, partial [Clostridiales bacterium]|nr:DegV family protein [Clostridiales bacterium]
MDIKITADSTCDLPQHLVEAYDIHLIPLYVVLGEQSYADRLEINPAQLFAYMKDDKHTCHTSAGMFAEYRQAFQDNQHFEAIIHISLSSVISCSHENAVMAAAKFNNVYVVDSANLCGGSGLIVERAAQLAALGLSAEEIVAQLQEMKAKIDSSFIVNNLEYLKRGGRCSSLSEISANLLQIKPVIEVTEGQMQAGKKYRGSFVKCVI